MQTFNPFSSPSAEKVVFSCSAPNYFRLHRLRQTKIHVNVFVERCHQLRQRVVVKK